MVAVFIIAVVVLSIFALTLMFTGNHPDQRRATQLQQMTPEQRTREVERKRRSDLGVVGRVLEDWQYESYAARRRQRERNRARYDRENGNGLASKAHDDLRPGVVAISRGSSRVHYV